MDNCIIRLTVEESRWERKEREKNEEIQEELEKTEVEKFRGLVESRRMVSKMSEDIVSSLLDEVDKLSANRLDEMEKDCSNKGMKEDCGPYQETETTGGLHTTSARSMV